ncbi:TIGR03915 family putative DNA repair protein [Mucilaginibacter calamicampi]|uniref:TIGR03915 family putative DNA repair protein n=1 Tax=Mucilaginibacter calamicampi TaxID=1302352 RepID=A0ABW2Z0H3_9SPHI
MTTIIYDGTYKGWLTAVFEIYEHKLQDITFAREGEPAASLFGVTHHVVTNQGKAERVLNGLKQKLSADGLNQLYKTFFSEVDKFDEKMWRYVQYVFASAHNVEGDLSNNAIWEVRQAAKFVHRESHRMKAFIRFKLTKDQLFYAIVEPDCAVLPLIADHFKKRYADQRWLIYDARRRYGVYYDLETSSHVELTFNTSASAQNITELYDEREEFFQDMWRRYFGSVNIKARKNLRLHVQHMPKRYWKYLTEKHPESRLL